MEEKKTYLVKMWLLGHKGFGATDTMLSILEDMDDDEICEKASWFGRNRGEAFSGDRRDVIELMVETHTLRVYPSDLPAIMSLLNAFRQVANEWADHNTVGGVTWTIDTLED